MPKWDVSVRKAGRYADLGGFPKELLLGPDVIKELVPNGRVYHTVRSLEILEASLTLGFRRSVLTDRLITPNDQGCGLYTTAIFQNAIPMRTMTGEGACRTDEPTIFLTLANIDLLNVVVFESAINHPALVEFKKMHRAEAMAAIAAKHHVDIFVVTAGGAGGGRQALRQELVVQNEGAVSKPTSVMDLLDQYERYLRTNEGSMRDRALIVGKLTYLQKKLGLSTSELYKFLDQLKDLIARGDIVAFREYIWLRSATNEYHENRFFDFEYLAQFLGDQDKSSDIKYLLINVLKERPLLPIETESILKTVSVSGIGVNWLRSSGEFYNPNRTASQSQLLVSFVEYADKYGVGESQISSLQGNAIQMTLEEYLRLKKFYDSRRPEVRLLMVEISLSPGEDWAKTLMKLLLDSDPRVRAAVLKKLKYISDPYEGERYLFSELWKLLPQVPLRERVQIITYMKTFPEWGQLDPIRKAEAYTGTSASWRAGCRELLSRVASASSRSKQ